MKTSTTAYNLNRVLVRASIAVAAAGAGLTATASTLDGARPNIVHILIDDLGWADLQCMGSDYYETPNIDKLRSQGMLFTNAYAAAPVCSPSRASIMTGRYPVRTGITDVFMPKKAVRMTRLVERITGHNLLPLEITVAEVLREVGYATACIGKWHLGSDAKSLPQNQGFDFVVPEVKRNEPGDYRGMNKYTRESVDFIKKNKDRPFYLYLSHTAVHLPYSAPDVLVEKYQRKLRPGMAQAMPIYAATIEYLDTVTGELLRKLDELGLTDNTLVIFTSDNGGRASNFDYQLVTRNLPLRAGKHTVYEGGLRVPFIVRWPGRIAANTTCDTPIHHIDYLPTFAALAGARDTRLPEIDGVNIAPLFGGGGIAPRPLYWFYPHYNVALTYGSNTIYESMRPAAVVLDEGWKLVEWLEDPKAAELFYLKEDMGERTNMVFAMPCRLADLRAKLEQWYASVGARKLESRVDYDPDRMFSVLWRAGESRYEGEAEGKYAAKELLDYHNATKSKKSSK